MQKSEDALDDVALVAGTQQNLSNLYSLDIYGSPTRWGVNEDEGKFCRTGSTSTGTCTITLFTAVIYGHLSGAPL